MDTSHLPSKVFSGLEQKALTLLGQGLSGEVVAAAVGVSASRISQLISNPEFSAAVADLRFQNLSKHSTRDAHYDRIEDQLLEKLENLLPMMYKPFEVLKAIAVINSAKRRGISSPDQLTGSQTVVQLTMPTQIIQNYTTNINNQVIKAGEQDLITIQSSRMKDFLTPTPLLQGTTNVDTPELSRTASSA